MTRPTAAELLREAAGHTPTPGEPPAGPTPTGAAAGLGHAADAANRRTKPNPGDLLRAAIGDRHVV